jgi:hypothetical protein
MKRVNYLNNRDLLLEIHRSKNSYCSYVAPEHHQYDLIVTDVKKINDATVAKARKVHAKRLTDEAWIAAKATGNKRLKMSDYAVSPRKIVKADLVFRVMTFDHINEDSNRKKNPKSIADRHVKVNFPPFQHWKFGDQDQLICVGKSHWIGGMENGYFSNEHGRTTTKLATMFMKLADRYSSRSNWRGYTYVDEMRSQALVQLSQIGLQFDESKSENPFAYYTAAITNSFTRILNIEKKNQNIRDDLLELNNMMPSYTRQAKSESEAQDIELDRLKKLAKKDKKIAKKIEPAPVKVYTKKALKELNKKLKQEGTLSSKDFEEVK